VLMKLRGLCRTKEPKLWIRSSLSASHGVDVFFDRLTRSGSRSRAFNS
jgi:hypothetical protein